MLGAFLGFETELFAKKFFNIGIGYYQELPSFSSKGDLIQGIDDLSISRFNYQYDIENKQLLLESKLLLKIKEYLYPYVYVGLGLAFNNTKNYSVSYGDQIAFNPIFTGNDTTSFSYSLGAGFDVGISKNWRLGAGYRFSDLGKYQFNSGSIDNIPINYALHKDYMYSQTLLAQLTYLIV